MQWKNPDGSITTGVVIEDGAGNKITSFSGGGAQTAISRRTATRRSCPFPRLARASRCHRRDGHGLQHRVAAGLRRMGGSGVLATTRAMKYLPAEPCLSRQARRLISPRSRRAARRASTYRAARASVSAERRRAAAAQRLGRARRARPRRAQRRKSAFIDGSGNLRAPSKTYPLPEAITDPRPAISPPCSPSTTPTTKRSAGPPTGSTPAASRSSSTMWASLDRQRETGFDGISAAGVAAGAQQLAGPPLSTTVTSGAITASTSPQNVTLAAVSFTNRGVTTTLQVGSRLLVDTGANQEAVVLTSRQRFDQGRAGDLRQSHAANVGVSSSHTTRRATRRSRTARRQPASRRARPTLQRAGADRRDGALRRRRAQRRRGIGTAIAAEYEWNAGGPLTNAGATRGWRSIVRAIAGQGRRRLDAQRRGRGGRDSITLKAAVGLEPRSTDPPRHRPGVEESAYVSQSFTAGSLAVPLQSALANAHSNGAAVAWDNFASAGPGLNGFTPAGIGIEEEALYDPSRRNITSSAPRRRTATRRKTWCIEVAGTVERHDDGPCARGHRRRRRARRASPPER